ncbi:hypothetical protein RvY_00192-1 [Ramazzottius varieornatus]|uniref:Major facilitator superfamily (MFS) profile domain-containing protein n=1 Tax=Ramazzottius varieornatus TaxID=947166 RepID=A0A1D1UJA1_RAMVA|nr:hypothetical protein RvY_00192-1 [Ramazzottius varieornatus]
MRLSNMSSHFLFQGVIWKSFSSEGLLVVRRWTMLTVFALCSMINAFQWIAYSIISDRVRDFYSVSLIAVDWLSMIYMLVYIPLVFPATWILESGGLRITLLLGSFGNFLGSLMKCGSAQRHLFGLTFFGQTVAAISQCFILGLPAQLAAVWFPANQVALATSVGVFGNQLGVALGFLIPPLIVHGGQQSGQHGIEDSHLPLTDETLELYGQQLLKVFVGVAIISAILFVLVLLVFQSSPDGTSPTNFESKVPTNYSHSLWKLAMNGNFRLILLSYGVNAGCFYAIGTLLNQIFLHFFQGFDDRAGYVGLTITLAGLVGSMIAGIVLAWSGKYKLVTAALYGGSCLSMVLFSLTMHLKVLWSVFLSSTCLGLFMTGYLPVGFEFAAQLTRPVPEGTSSGLLNCCAQVCGLILIPTIGATIGHGHPSIANGILVGLLAFGFALTILVKSKNLPKETSTPTAMITDSAVY